MFQQPDASIHFRGSVEGVVQKRGQIGVKGKTGGQSTTEERQRKYPIAEVYASEVKSIVKQ
jgi:hypothetical protein